MKRILVWDLPTRLFHWLLAGSVLSAFGLAALLGDEGGLFPIHMLLGLVAAMLVAMRLVWGLVGSRTSRLSLLALRPEELFTYLRGVFRGRSADEWPAHNPAASWVMVATVVCVLGLAGTGLLMSRGVEVVEEIHEMLAWTMMGIVAVHLTGIAVHTVRHREPIALSMIDGRRLGDLRSAIPSARPLAGLVFLILAGAWAGGLVRGYDPATSTVRLPLLGSVLSLGEGEEGEEGEEHEGWEDED